MKITKHAIIAVAGILFCSMVSVNVRADAPAGKTADACSGSAAEQEECLAKEYKKWDDKLNEAYQKGMAVLIEKIKNHKNTPEGDALIQYRKMIVESELTWIKYRDANCIAYSLSGGPIAHTLGNQCMIRMTQEREQELENMVEP